MKKAFFLSCAVLILVQPLDAGLKWTKPVDISEAEIDPHTYRLAVNLKGDAVAIWAEEKMIGPIKAATKSTKEGWSEPQTLSLSPGMNPQVVIDEEGNVTAIWMDQPPHGNILSSTKLAWGEWEYPPKIVSSGFALNSKISIDAEGTICVTWADKKSGDFFSLAKPFHQDWSLLPEGCEQNKEREGIEVEVNDFFSLTKESHLKISSDKKGTLLAAWQGSEEGCIVCAAKSPEGIWSSPEVISPLKRAISNLQAVYDGEGDLFLLFRDSLSHKMVILTKTSQEGWSKPSFFTTGFLEERPLVKLSSNGQVFILWQDSASKHLFVSTGVWEKPKTPEKSTLSFSSKWWWQ
jgi:hypothetical protein